MSETNDFGMAYIRFEQNQIWRTRRKNTPQREKRARSRDV